MENRSMVVCAVMIVLAGCSHSRATADEDVASKPEVAQTPAPKDSGEEAPKEEPREDAPRADETQTPKEAKPAASSGRTVRLFGEDEGSDTSRATDDSDEEGKASGFSGMGLSGTGRGGGGISESGIGVANIGTKGYGRGSGQSRRSTSRIIPGKPKIRGSLDKEIIRRVVRRHRNELRYCYDKARLKDDTLAGQIELKFTISGKGKVISAAIASSTLASPEAESCMTDKAKRWMFPEPKGGGIVIVTYPLTFSF